MAPELIINADDFGWTDGHNLAVQHAFRLGALTSASLMANNAGFSQAVSISLENPELRVGAHLALNETTPVSKPDSIPNLVNAEGKFHDSAGKVAWLWMSRKLKAEEIIQEWQAQIERIMKSLGKITHLDSHKHVHLFPPVFEAMLKLAVEYGVPYVRLPLERFHLKSLRRTPFWVPLWVLSLRARPFLQSAGLKFADRFEGFSESGQMTYPTLQSAVMRSEAGKLVEIMVHPAVLTSQVKTLQQRYRWAAAYRFEEELQALIALGKNRDPFQ